MAIPTLEYDLAVIGGGPAGVGASVVAAHQGRRVLLIERYGFLGGVPASAFLLPWRLLATNTEVPSENFSRIMAYAKTFNNHRGIFPDPLDARYKLLLIEPEIIKFVFQEFALAAGVKLLLHAKVIAAEQNGDQITALMLHGQEGKILVKAPLYIDCTGFGVLAGRASHVLPPIYSFVLTGVDYRRLPQIWRRDHNLAGYVDEANGLVFLRGLPALLQSATPDFAAIKEIKIDPGFRPGEVIVHVVLNEINPEDIAALTVAELLGQKVSNLLTAYFQRHWPGFANARILMTPAEVGFAGAYDYVSAPDNRYISLRANNLLCAGRPALEFNFAATSLAPHTFADGEAAAHVAVSLQKFYKN